MIGIDKLLKHTQENPFLLCSVASKRAVDINNMVRGQHLRVAQVMDHDDITTAVSGKDAIDVAMTEIEDGKLTYDVDAFEEEIKGEDTND